MRSPRWRSPYDRFARDYHAKRGKPAGGFYNDQLDLPALTALIKTSVAGKSVLDLGCGSGLFTRRLKAWGGCVRGLDKSAAMVAIARAENPDIPFTVGDARRAPFAPRSFDIVAAALLAHYFRDLDPLFREVSRLLKPGGIWAFSFHHPFNETLRILHRKGRPTAAAGPYFHERPYAWKIGKMRLVSFHHTLEAVLEGLHAEGFVVERLLEPRPPARARHVSPRGFALTRAYPFFCAIRARKE